MQTTNTRKQIFYPYKYVNHGIDIKISELKVDDSVINDSIDLINRKINLCTKEFDNIVFFINLVAEKKLYKSVFRDQEKHNPPCSAFLILNCDETKYRDAIQLNNESENTWCGEVKLQKKFFQNRITFVAYIVRNDDFNGSDNGFSKNYGEKLLSSHEWTIQIDEPNKFLGNFLPCEWEDFKKSSHPILSKNPELIYYLDFDSDPPRLVLNEAIENLKSILSNESKIGTIPTIRDVIFDSISQQVWLNLILTAAQSVDDIEGLKSWQGAVLKQYASPIYPDSDEDSAIANLIRDSQDKDRIHILLSKLNVAIQNKLRIDKSTKYLLNLSLKENNSL